MSEGSSMISSFLSSAFFWVALYLVGYVISILMLALFGFEKIEEKMPAYFLRIFIFLVFVLPPIVLPFTEGPKIAAFATTLLLIGALFVGAALVIRLIAQRQIGVLPFRAKEGLVTTGIYGFARHPLYLSNGLFAIGIALLFDSLYAFLFSILYTLLYLPVIYFEEKDLLKKYGDEYRKYKERTGLLFPRKV